LAGIGLSWFSGKWNSVVAAAISALLGVVLANALVFVIVLSVNRVRAGKQLYGEQNARLRERDEQIAAFNKTKGHLDGLRKFLAEAKFFEDRCFKKAPIAEVKHEFDGWKIAAFNYLQKELNEEGYAHLFFAATEVDHMPTEAELRRHGMVQDEYFYYLCNFRAKNKYCKTVSTN
jgi:hypothetical protein